MHRTPYEDVNSLLDDLLARMHGALGQNLVGVYLYGSLVTGDFDPGCSDIDLLAVIASDINVAEAQRLGAMHDAVARDHPRWAGRIEVAYLSAHALKTFRTQRSPIAVISPGEPFHVKDAGPDWLMNWYVVRDQGLMLLGPPPSAFIDPITKHEFIQSLREHAEGWSDWIEQAQELKPQSYAILTMCRTLYAVRTGEQASKWRAAEWTQAELPEWAGLVRDALLWRELDWDGPTDPAATYPEAVRFVSFVRAQLAR